MTINTFSRDNMLIYQGKEEGLEEGMEKGQSILIKAIKLLREGKTRDDLLKQGFDQNTIDLAYAKKRPVTA